MAVDRPINSRTLLLAYRGDFVLKWGLPREVFGF